MCMLVFAFRSSLVLGVLGFGWQLKLPVAVSGVIFFRKYENRKIVSIHFDDLLLALHLSKLFSKWATCAFNKNEEQKNAFCQRFLSSFLRLFKMQCSSITIEKFKYYSFDSIIFIVDQSVCCGSLWFDLPRKFSWTLLWRWARNIILLVKWLIL